MEKKLCRLCGKVKNIVRSHIIPKSFAIRMSGQERSPPKLLSDQKEFPEKSPTGIYDLIFCESCEKIFSDCDNYIYKFLTKEKFSILNYPIEGASFHIYDNIQREKINKFVASVLFRASASERDELKNVKLGKYHELLKNYLMKSDKFPSIFEYIIICNPDIYIISYPMPGRYSGLNFYAFVIGNHEFHIKINQRKMPKVLSEFSNNINPLRVLIRDKNKTPTSRLLKSLVDKIERF